MRRINANELARSVTLEEGQKINLTIAQVKEVQRLTFEILINEYMPSQVLELLERYYQ